MRSDLSVDYNLLTNPLGLLDVLGKAHVQGTNYR